MNGPFTRAAVFSLTLLGAAVLTACDTTEHPQQQANQPPPKVGIVTLEAKPFTLISELPGRTTAYRVAEVRPQVSGIIQKRLFTEGSEVKAGQQLYQIDPATYQATLKSAEARLLSASTLAKRYKLLVEEKAVSQQQYDDANAARLQAEAAVEQARIDVKYTKVLAPIDGRIGRSRITEGALVSNGQAQELAVIQQLDPIYVDVTQSANDLLRLRSDLAEGRLEKSGDNSAQVSLRLEDGSAYPHQGTLEFSEVSVEASTGTVTLRAVFPNPDGILLPGMFVQASLASGVNQQAILAPQQGVSRNSKGQPIAMVLNADNQVESRLLKAERTVGNHWLINEGLNAGDRLITEGLQWIQPGVTVDPYPAKNIAQGETAQSLAQ